MADHFFRELFWWSPLGIYELLIVAAILAFVCWLFFRRRGSFSPAGPYPGSDSDTAMEILKKRYARGEITKEEFEVMKRDLLN